jgi:hypothetical protein
MTATARRQHAINHFLDFHVRHHLAADLTEARQASVILKSRPQRLYRRSHTNRRACLRSQFRLAEIADHDVGSLDEEQPLLVCGQRLAVSGSMIFAATP